MSPFDDTDLPFDPHRSLDFHDQARAHAQALRRQALVLAWAEVDRRVLSGGQSAGRAARRLAQRLSQHWRQRGRATGPAAEPVI
jgi:hypothetical protein